MSGNEINPVAIPYLYIHVALSRVPGFTDATRPADQRPAPSGTAAAGVVCDGLRRARPQQQPRPSFEPTSSAVAPNTVLIEQTTQGSMLVNGLRPEQNGRHFTADIFKCIYLNGNLIFWFKFRWSLLLEVQLTMDFISISSRNGLSPNKQQTLVRPVRD